MNYFICFFAGILFVLAIETLIVSCVVVALKYDILGRFEKYFVKRRDKSLASELITKYNQSDAGGNPGSKPENKEPETEKYNPETAEANGLSKLRQLEQELQGLQQEEAGSIDLFDQVSTKQRQYAEEYFKIHKKLPPGYEGV